MAGKKISQLPITTLPTMDGSSPLVLSGTTYQSSLSDLRQNLVDSGSHYFTGSQHISGNLNVTGTGSIKEYLSVGKFGGPVDNWPESLRVENSGSINTMNVIADNDQYAQINLQNKSSELTASGDIVITADNGNEFVHYVDLGINSSTYIGGFVGKENDAYLLNVGNDLFVGTVGGINHPSNLILFAQNNWEDPQMIVSGSGQISFNTGSVSEGYQYEFSGSVKLSDDLLVDGSLNIGSVNEKIILNEGGGNSTYEFDYNSGSVFYLTGSVSDNVYNVSNVPTDNQKAVSLTFVVKQETTPYIASSYKINNEEIIINWANGDLPTKNSNNTDVIGLTAFKFGSSWNVLGIFTTFGL